MHMITKIFYFLYSSAEVKALNHLLSAQIEISEWAFFSSVIQLQHAALVLTDVKALATLTVNVIL